MTTEFYEYVGLLFEFIGQLLATVAFVFAALNAMYSKTDLEEIKHLLWAAVSMLIIIAIQTV